MFNIEQDKEFTQLNMQNNSLTPSQPQQQLQQSVIPTQFSQQQNGYSTQYALAPLLVNEQQYQQQIRLPDDSMAPFNHNFGNVPPALYSSNDLVIPMQTQLPQMSTIIKSTLPSQQQQQKQQYRPDSTVGSSTRLSDEDDEQFTTDQFKMMTSKERRQLRNKLSARNFRNRRKEYITSLEEQVNTFKNENSQLQLEINWVRTTLTKLQNENDDLRVKLALCKGGITTKQQSTLSNYHSSQGLQQHSSRPTATTTTAPVLQSDHPPPVQPTSTTNNSQNSVIFTSAVTQNGNSLFTIPDLHGSNPHHQPYSQPAIQQQPTASSSSSSSLSSSPPNNFNLTQQQPASFCPREIKEKLNPSTLVTTSPSPPGSNLESIDATHSGSSSFCPADRILSTNTLDMTIPDQAIPLTYPLDTTTAMSQQPQQLLVPPLFENTGSFYSMESHQNSISTNRQQHSTSTHHQSCHVNQQQHDQQTSSTGLQLPSHQLLEHTTIIDNNRNSNNSNVSTVVFPDFDFGTALEKQQQVNDGSILWKYPLLIPALVSIIIDHTMNMSTNELLSHSRHLSASSSVAALAPVPSYCMKNPGGKLKPYLGSSGNNMAPGLRCTRLQHDSNNLPSSLTATYPLTKKQLDALWDHLLNQMVVVNKTSQEQKTTMAASHDDNSPQTLWYETPVTGFKSICPLYWIQRQLCRFVITYVIVKYPQLENPCKTYLPICEQFRRRLVTTAPSSF